MRNQIRRTFLVETLESRRLLASDAMVISEIMYNPVVSDQERVSGFKDRDFEFVEFLNTGDTPIELSGEMLSDAVDFTFGQTTVQPGEQVVAVSNRQAFEIRYGRHVPIAGEYFGTLGNGGDRIVFADATGQFIQDLTYDDAWYARTDGAGNSLTAVDPENVALDRNLATSWQRSSRINGSPGHFDGNLDPRPTQPTFVVQSSRQVEITWTAADGFDPSTQSHRVYRDETLIGTTTETFFIDSTVAPNSRFEYQVASMDAEGVESFSEPGTFNMETVGGDLRFESGKSQGVVSINGFIELSGLSGSRQNTNIFWTHDDGPGSSIFAINARGKHVATVLLQGIQSADWEDITIGPGPETGVDYIYIGDIGGKDPKRNEVLVHRIREPKISPDELGTIYDIANVDTILLRYADGNIFNAETLMADPQTGDLYVIPKLGSGTPIYRAAAAEISTDSVVSLEMVGQIGFPNVSGGDISPSGNEILIRNEDLAQLFWRTEGQSIADALLTGKQQLVPVVGRPTEPNGEAITFAGDGRNYFTISEGVNPALYSFHRVPTALAGDANRDQLFGTADLVQVFQSAKYDSGKPALFSEGDWNGDGVFDSGDLVAAFQTGLFELPTPAVKSTWPFAPRTNAFSRSEMPRTDAESCIL